MEKDPRTHASIGAAMDVHRIMGPDILKQYIRRVWRLNLMKEIFFLRRIITVQEVYQYKGTILSGNKFWSFCVSSEIFFQEHDTR